MSQTSSFVKRQSKKKRKKSDPTSPTSPKLNKNKKTKCDSDTEYQSAAEFSEAIGEHPPTKQSPGIESAMAIKLSDADVQKIVSKFTLRDDDIDRIVSRVRQSIMSDLKTELIAEHIAPLATALTETRNLLADKVAENEQLKSDINDLKLEIDEQEQYSRRSCLRLNGVTGDEGDPNENVEAKLLYLAETHNIDIQPSDIDIAHRLGKPKMAVTRSVIVKFTNSKARQRVLSARKRLGSVYVNEDLTRFRQSLHYEARQLVRAKKIVRTWIAGGKVFCNVPVPGSIDGIRFHIRSMVDIEKLGKGPLISSADRGPPRPPPPPPPLVPMEPITSDH